MVIKAEHIRAMIGGIIESVEVPMSDAAKKQVKEDMTRFLGDLIDNALSQKPKAMGFGDKDVESLFIYEICMVGNSGITKNLLPFSLN